MSRIRLAIVSLLLGAAVLTVPATAFATVDHTAQAADIGWGVASTDDEPPATEAPATTEAAAQDIGWG